MELPSLPDSGDDDTADHRPASAVDRGVVIVIAIVAAVLAAMVLLHLTGIVGPGTH